MQTMNFWVMVHRLVQYGDYGRRTSWSNKRISMEKVGEDHTMIFETISGETGLYIPTKEDIKATDWFEG